MSSIILLECKHGHVLAWLGLEPALEYGVKKARQGQSCPAHLHERGQQLRPASDAVVVGQRPACISKHSYRN